MFNPENILIEKEDFYSLEGPVFIWPGTYGLFYGFETHEKSKKSFPFQMLLEWPFQINTKRGLGLLNTFPSELVKITYSTIFPKPKNWPYMPREEVLILNLRGYYEFWNPNTFSEYMKLPHDFSNLELSIV